MKPSRYNFAVKHATRSWIVFNARTGKLIHFAGSNSSELICALTRGDAAEEVNLDNSTLDLLLRNEFIIKDDFDELAAIRARFWAARKDAPIVVTITTTLDCNLGCFYCYEARNESRLTVADIPAIAVEVRKLLSRSSRNALHVDWYGGEPTLNLQFLEEASCILQQVCQEYQVNYSASIVSNGTAWPINVEEFVRSHRIRQAQITFDGLRETHDKRRRFTSRTDSRRSSFDEAVSLVSKLVRLCRVDLRFNVDDRNKQDFLPFVRFAHSQRWFEEPHRVTFQPARIGGYTEKARFVERIELSEDEFCQLKRKAVALLPPNSMEEPETPDGYATPKTSVCAALSQNALVFGADRNLFRCGLQVSEPHRAIGQINSELFPILNQRAAFTDTDWWHDFDPTVLPACSTCSFLPLCLGGCPKKQLEQDYVALHAQSVYWRKNLPRLICKAFGVEEVEAEYSEDDQFRPLIAVFETSTVQALCNPMDVR